MRLEVLVGTSLLCLTFGTAQAWAQPAQPPPGAAPSATPDAVPGAAPAAAQPPLAASADEPTAVVADTPPGASTSEPVPAPDAEPPLEPVADDEPAAALPPPPPPMPRLFALGRRAEQDRPLVGLAHGRLFVRDPDDVVRLYPGARLELDFRSTLGRGVGDLGVGQSGGAPAAQFTVRRLRLELSGELFGHVDFTAGAELGGQRVGDAELTGDHPRFAPADALDGVIRPAVVSLGYRYRPWLNVTAGQLHVPFSMANRTDEAHFSMLERPLAIRGLGVPHDKDLGVMLWGELDERLFAYEVGVFTGDGANRLAPDPWPDFVGRIFSRPFTTLGDDSFLRFAQIGVSGRYGAHDPERVDYDAPAIATGNGFVLWQPGYHDVYGRLEHVIPSGDGWALGGELRLPFDLPGGRAIELRGEVVYSYDHTREAVDGYQLTNTERFGRLKGLGWYALLSAWPWGDSFVSGEPGVMRAPTLNDEPELRIPKGLELFAVASGVVANYSGATREGSTPDPYTPSSNIAVYELGGGAQYWYGTLLRFAVQYLAYYAPDSGDPRRNQAVVVEDIAPDARAWEERAHLMHELTARAAVTF